MWMVRLAILAVTPPSPFSHQVFPYKQPFSTVSSVVPVECWKSDPSLQFWLLTMVVNCSSCGALEVYKPPPIHPEAGLPAL